MKDHDLENLIRSLKPGPLPPDLKERMAVGEDLYRLAEGAFADIDPTLVVTQDLCAVCAVDVSEVFAGTVGVADSVTRVGGSS